MDATVLEVSLELLDLRRQLVLMFSHHRQHNVHVKLSEDLLVLKEIQVCITSDLRCTKTTCTHIA
jgi:hypothetical protein